MAAVTANTNGVLSSFWSPKATDIKSLKVYFSPKQEGSGNPSPSNVRPIIGWTGVEVTRCGKNLLPVTDTAIQNEQDITKLSKDLTLVASAYTDRPAIETRPSYPGGQFIVYDKNDTQLKYWSMSPLTGYSNRYYRQLAYPVDFCKYRVNTYSYDAQLELGETPTEFEAYNGNTYSVSWQSEHGTIYGGYLDLVTGTLVQTWGSDYADKNTTWGFGTTGASSPSAPYRAYYKISDSKEVAAQMIYSNILTYTDRYYPEAFHANINANKRFTIGLPSEISTRELFDDWLDSVNGLTIYYELVEPITYQLTPQQIKTLVGRNNIWSNADSVEVEYEYVESPELTLLKKRIIQNEPHPQIVHGTTATFNNDMVSKVKSYKVDFKPIQEGSGDPSPTNVRTITGHTGLDIWKSGKNIAHILGYSAQALNKPTNTRYATNNYGTTLSTTDPASSVIVTQSQWPKTDNPVTYQNGYFDIIDDNLTYNKRYNLSFRVTNITNNPLNVPLENLTVYYPSGSGIGAPIVQGDKLIYKNALYKQLTTRPELHGFEIRNSGMSFTLSDYMVTEATEEDQTYEAFKGNNLSVDWTSVAGTLYGGYIDLITGNLVAEWKKIKISDLTWYNYSQKIRYYAMINNNQSQNDRVAFSEIYSDTLTPKSDGQFTQAEVGYLTYFGDGTDATIGQNNKNNIWTTLPEAMESTEANAWIQQTYPNAYIAYKLANPITYQLTPQQITTFNGKNNFWTTNVDSFPEISFWTHRRKKKVIWNQWLKPYNSTNWKAYNSSYISTSFSNGICTAEWLTNEKLGYYTSVVTKVGASQTEGDIIYVSYMLNPSVGRLTWGAEFGNNNQLTFNYNSSIDANKWIRISGMAACKGTRSNYAYFSYCRGSQSNIQTGMTCQTKAPIEINLTQMFGAGNEPETVEEFERICILNGINLNEYQPYDTGTEVEWLI